MGTDDVDPVGFFEPLYVAAAAGQDAVPWDRGAPHPLVAEWAADVDGAGRSALVVGSGLGPDAELLAERGFAVVAFDVSPTAIASTRERFPDSPVRYEVANLLEPPPSWHHAFDLVLESLTVQSMPPQFHADAIANVARMVAPGGTLLVVATARDAAAGTPDGPPWPLTRAEVESFASEGLRAVEIEAIRGTGVPPRWRARFQRPDADPASPDPARLHPVAGQQRVVFLRAVVEDPRIEVGEYTYYDDPDDPLGFERRAVLYGFGPERLVIGRFCAIAAGVRFLMPGANHADLGPSTFPFGIFGEPWAAGTMDLVMGAPSRGDTIVGHDVWLGYQALVLPGVRIGHGAVVAAASVVTADVPPYAVVAGNPARLIRHRFGEADVARLLRAAWWDWPIALVTEHARTIMAGTPQELERIAQRHGLPAPGDTGA
ncbi:MAG: methyltransferase domain-containing protein [Solirubrobacteraceae bacterium]|nr:methyltransferase domain-containing protein [Solirubrobacteraceae bacterium]